MILFFYILSLFYGMSVGECSYNTTIKCKANEILNLCPEYCTFDDTCYAKIFGGLSKICPVKPLDYKCMPRCECKSGFVRIETACELIEKCCGLNEEIVDCPALCEETCNSSPKPGCKLQRCFEKGCRCKKGFVSIFGDECVPFDKCETTCEFQNAVYNPCGPANPPTCRDRNPINNGPCVRDCFCKEGYIRNNVGKCILIENCPPPCSGPNEEIIECGTCDPNCDDLNPICSQECKKGCFCKKGFVRNKNGDCIDPESCPKASCRKNTVWKECFGGCDPTCGAPNYKCNACVDGCFCKDGYVRDLNSFCIKLEDCPIPIKCDGQNEEFSDCINKCTSGVSCGEICKSGCVCKNGYIRRNEICVINSETKTTLVPKTTVKPTITRTTMKIMTTTKISTSKCNVSKPKATSKLITCSSFETYSKCLPEKEPTCEDHLIVPAKVCKSGCTCMPGHVRNNGKCIPAGECKRNCYH